MKFIQRPIELRHWEKGRGFTYWNARYSSNYKHNVIITQFTGLLDKNKKKIFEGDIVEVYFGSKPIGLHLNPEIIEFKDGQFLASNHEYCLKHYVNGVKIIGNIFENPELLK